VPERTDVFADLAADLAATNPDLFEKMTAGADRDFDAAVFQLHRPHLDASPHDLLALCADTVGARREYNDRVGYQVRGLTPPEAEFRYELTAPMGAVGIRTRQRVRRFSGPGRQSGQFSDTTSS
jgi:hypothetical protein